MSKIAAVTGAGQGIGFAIAKRLYNDGFKVAIIDYNEETAQKAAKELGENSFAVKADVSDREQVISALNAVVDKFGDLNVVHLNNFIRSIILMLVEFCGGHKQQQHFLEN